MGNCYKKNEYKIEELCTYIQIDTVIPKLSEYEFLRKRKFRVHTVKFRDQISQDLIVSLPKGKWKEGDVVTDILGIKNTKNQIIILNDMKNLVCQMFGIKNGCIFLSIIFYLSCFQNYKAKVVPPPKNLVSITNEKHLQNIPQVLNKYAGKWKATKSKRIYDYLHRTKYPTLPYL